MKSYTRFVQRLKKQNKKNSRRRGCSSEQKGKNTQIDSAWCSYGTVFSRTEGVIGSTARSDDGASGYQ